MARQASVINRLESIVGPGGIRVADDLHAFDVDGLTPQAAVSPGTYDEVAEVMRYAHAEELAVIPRGGGAHMHIGNVPARYDIALSLSRLNQIVEHEPADLTATCQAGITLDSLQTRMAEHGQLVPLSLAPLPYRPGPQRQATVGGMLAANVSGPARHEFGAPRDFTIGLRLITADGRVTKAGGRVVKNVAGYDLCKLYIGSLGTLGVIVEATFKLAARPPAERRLSVSFDAPSPACAFSAGLRRRGLVLRSVLLLNSVAASAAGLSSQGTYTLLLHLAGTPQAVDRSQREIVALAGESTAPVTEFDTAAPPEAGPADPSPEDASVLCKASALPTRVPALLDALGAIDGPTHVLALPTIGIVYAAWAHPDNLEQTIRAMRSAASEAGGSLTLERCPPDVKRRLDIFGDPGPSFSLMQSIKQRFDPKGVLSPGRHVGRL